MDSQLSITIRPVQPKDAAGIAGLLREMGWFAHLAAEVPEATTARIRRNLDLCAADDSHTILTAVKGDDTVAGYIAVHWLLYLILMGPEGYVSELFVRVSERGRGIGTRLLDGVKQVAQERGCARLMLINGRHRESYARQFYIKNGWQERPEMANLVYLLKPAP